MESLGGEPPEELLDIETFYFHYPLLAALADLVSRTHPKEYILDDHKYDLVRFSARIESLDDFTLMSANQLHVWTGIPMDKIRMLYKSAEMMIIDFHTMKQDVINEIQRLCEAGQRMVAISSEV